MDYLELFNEVDQMEQESADRIPLLEEIIRQADCAQDIRTGVEARWALIETCLFVGFPKKQLAAFSWLIHLYETTENEIDVYDLLWHYKWIAEDIVHFSEISLAKINQLTLDMQTKFREYSYSLRPYYKVKMLQAISIGNQSSAKENFILWQGAYSDFMNDCPACETTEIVSYYHFIGDYANAIKAAEPILSGKQSCAEVPHLTYGHTALAYVHLKQFDKAKASFELGYPLVKKHATLVLTIAQFIEYLVLVNEPEKALELYHENLATVETLENEFDKMHFYRSGTLLDLPNKQEVLAKALEYAKKFDQRNKNSYYTDLLIKK